MSQNQWKIRVPWEPPARCSFPPMVFNLKNWIFHVYFTTFVPVTSDILFRLCKYKTLLENLCGVNYDLLNYYCSIQYKLCKTWNIFSGILKYLKPQYDRQEASGFFHHSILSKRTSIRWIVRRRQRVSGGNKSVFIYSEVTVYTILTIDRLLANVYNQLML